MWLSVVCVSSHGAVGWSAIYDSGHNHLLLGCVWRYRTDKSYIRHKAQFFTPLSQIIKKPTHQMWGMKGFASVARTEMWVY